MAKADNEDDLRLARDLLVGRWGEMGEVTYLKGEDALRARKALARLLLAGPLDRTLAEMLAAVFAPPETMSFWRVLRRSDGATVLATAAGLRTINFKRRSNKRSVPCLRDQTVWAWMQQRLDDKTPPASKTRQRKR
jgi:hypothetical protein